MTKFAPWQAKGPTKHSVAEKTVCLNGHRHDSKREAKRCDQLDMLVRAGSIAELRNQPFYPFGAAKLDNGHTAGLTADFAYIENGREIVEDVKPRSKKADSRDWPLRKAMMRHFHPNVVLREVRS